MIDDLPIISRDFAELAKLAPGTTQTGTTGTGQGSGVSVGGARPTSNAIVVDGASNGMQFYGRPGQRVAAGLDSGIPGAHQRVRRRVQARRPAAC